MSCGLPWNPYSLKETHVDTMTSPRLTGYLANRLALFGFDVDGALADVPGRNLDGEVRLDVDPDGWVCLYDSLTRTTWPVVHGGQVVTVADLLADVDGTGPVFAIGATVDVIVAQDDTLDSGVGVDNGFTACRSCRMHVTSTGCAWCGDANPGAGPIDPAIPTLFTASTQEGSFR